MSPVSTRLARITARGGFDNDGYSYSTTKIGSTIVWNGLTFNIGPANAQDAVANQTITLPAGQYTNLYMLGAMVNNIAASQTFTVTYTDNTTTQVTQNMSDWVYAAGWPGESVVNCNFDRNFDDGTTQADSVCVYGYQIPLNSSKTVKSVTLPNTRNIVMLSMDLTTPAIPGTFVYNPPAGTIEPVGTDTLSVTFTPTDSTDYTTSTATVQLVVDTPNNPIETPTIQWPTPAAYHLRHAFELHPTGCGSYGTVSTHSGSSPESIAGAFDFYRRYRVFVVGFRRRRQYLFL